MHGDIDDYDGLVSEPEIDLGFFLDDPASADPEEQQEYDDEYQTDDDSKNGLW